MSDSAANPAETGRYCSGKTGLLGFFIGEGMGEMRGQGNPMLPSEVATRLLVPEERT